MSRSKAGHRVPARKPKPSPAAPDRPVGMAGLPQLMRDTTRLWTLIGWEFAEFRSAQLRKAMLAAHQLMRARDADQMIDAQSAYWEAVAQDYLEEVERVADLWGLALTESRTVMPLPPV